jgi:hypothetical protein
MEQRVKQLEEQMVDVRERLSAIESLLRTYPEIFATKADLHREMQALTAVFYQALIEHAARTDTQLNGMREDLHKQGIALQDAINKQTWRLISFVTGFGLALTSAIYFIASHVR